MGWLDWSFGEDARRYKKDSKLIDECLKENKPERAFEHMKFFISESYFDSLSVVKRDKLGENALLSEISISLSKNGYHSLALEAIDLIDNETIRTSTAISLEPDTLTYANEHYGKDD